MHIEYSAKGANDQSPLTGEFKGSTLKPKSGHHAVHQGAMDHTQPLYLLELAHHSSLAGVKAMRVSE
jgi:hypothetical protein